MELKGAWFKPLRVFFIPSVVLTSVHNQVYWLTAHMDLVLELPRLEGTPPHAATSTPFTASDASILVIIPNSTTQHNSKKKQENPGERRSAGPRIQISHCCGLECTIRTPPMAKCTYANRHRIGLQYGDQRGPYVIHSLGGQVLTADRSERIQEPRLDPFPLIWTANYCSALGSSEASV